METIYVKSIAQSHRALGIKKPKHPLFSIVRFEDMPKTEVPVKTRLIFDYYQIVFKKNCPNKLQYGQTKYDFDEGVMSYFAPKQVSIVEPGLLFPTSGWTINLHPDFFVGSELNKKIKDYGFFEYAVSEALILSEDEEKVIENILHQINREYNLPIDKFSQDVVISNLELLLTYSNRYYSRQFIVRKPTNDSLLSKFEKLLNQYFEFEIVENGLPTVNYFAAKLNLSSKYFSDLLKEHSGLTAQQHIHEKLIEKAKEKLTATELSISEIAHELGFEYPQSFSKLFKSKIGVSPLEFRVSFN
jgi:AraC family transcriptional activator of pobA